MALAVQWLSNSAVGSSSKSKLGSFIKANIKFKRRFCPLERSMV
jgi:hypothetical protein